MKVVLILSALCVVVRDHGRLLELPSRGSAWRFGFDTPRNHGNNQLFCGGFQNVTVELTANHLGYFEMRLCPHTDPQTAISEDCLNRHLLSLSDGSGTRFAITGTMRMVTFNVRLPRDVVCMQCVVQWKYNTGNSWGIDLDTGVGCKGCGRAIGGYGNRTGFHQLCVNNCSRDFCPSFTCACD
ncbi:hypothetical protein CAPTEDRAFT_212716 [Capitella teleta]|uniref:Chitin-binding type-4 domain-containing protein n=1 Tax=Capitella teleta TaxID=283909 RepID=R7UJ63_CAPTE|nr:hypothetical protein CAPTEDRAFT_212716 [Capitella teleta]|eukprot:ELU06118.1 hypothetical protein CAPTEDRAFT_212716 [Capitella teleta]